MSCNFFEKSFSSAFNYTIIFPSPQLLGLRGRVPLRPRRGRVRLQAAVHAQPRGHLGAAGHDGIRDEHNPQELDRRLPADIFFSSLVSGLL